jgi:hypothetical protein
MKRRVIGLDVSANRIAFAICDSVKMFDSIVIPRRGRDLAAFVNEAAAIIRKAMEREHVLVGCLEINLHPRITHKGHVSPKMIRAYMRSRWVEGAVLGVIGFDEPFEMERKHKMIATELGWTMYSLPATGGKDAKRARRERMMMLYGGFLFPGVFSEDEIDALAIAHDCAVALNLAERGVQS